MIDFKFLWDTYGPYGVALYIVGFQLWPFFRDKYFPTWTRRRLSDIEHERKIEERGVAAYERIAASMESTHMYITVQNEKLNNLLTLHLEHDRFLKESLMHMSQKKNIIKQSRAPRVKSKGVKK